MRFPESDGWTQEILDKYLIKGNFAKRGYGADEKEDAYFILTPGSKINTHKIIKDGHVGDLLLKSQWHELAGLNDKDILEKRNG